LYKILCTVQIRRNPQIAKLVFGLVRLSENQEEERYV
jgi:hypothetical protein